MLHRWIKEHLLPEMSIDVANYAHVPDGPGVVLIGDANDYFVDLSLAANTGPQLGLLVSRKRHAPAPDQRLNDLFRRTVHAAMLLERDPALAGKVSFRTDEWVVRVNDRLAAPNTPETVAALRPEIEAFASQLFTGATVTVTPAGEPRQLVTAPDHRHPRPGIAGAAGTSGRPAGLGGTSLTPTLSPRPGRGRTSLHGQQLGSRATTDPKNPLDQPYRVPGPRCLFALSPAAGRG